MYSGLRTQDLQEAKDQLLVETSDMLHIPLFTAEALLRDNGAKDVGVMCIFLSVLCFKFRSDNFKFLSTEWSRETLLDKWMINPVQCCQSAGVQPPPSSSYAGTGILCLTRSINSPSVIEESNSCDEEEPEETGGCKDSPKSPGKCSTLVTKDEPSKGKGEMEVIYLARIMQRSNRLSWFPIFLHVAMKLLHTYIRNFMSLNNRVIFFKYFSVLHLSAVCEHVGCASQKHHELWPYVLLVVLGELSHSENSRGGCSPYKLS